MLLKKPNATKQKRLTAESSMVAFATSLSCSDSFSNLLCGEDSNIIFSAGVGDSPEYSSDIESRPPDVEESIAGLLEDERDLAGINSPPSHQSIDASTRAESGFSRDKLEQLRLFMMDRKLFGVGEKGGNL